MLKLDLILGQTKKLLKKALELNGFEVKEIEHVTWCLLAQVRDKDGRRYKVLYDTLTNTILEVRES